MPDKRKHRGPHPEDTVQFAAEQWPALREATSDLSWLRARGYSESAARKVVGDRYALRRRQREAVGRAACTDAERDDRAQRRAGVDDLRGRVVGLDGFNCVIAVEAALSGAPLMIGRDGVYRDLSSVHGSYRKVAETQRAVELIARLLDDAAARAAAWYLDRPVSNSGRLKQLIAEVFDATAVACTIELVDNPDRALMDRAGLVVASGDSLVLDGCGDWIDLPAAVLRNRQDLWIVDLRSENLGG